LTLLGLWKHFHNNIYLYVYVYLKFYIVITSKSFHSWKAHNSPAMDKCTKSWPTFHYFT